jgi:hypothetical protein
MTKTDFDRKVALAVSLLREGARLFVSPRTGEITLEWTPPAGVASAALKRAALAEISKVVGKVRR